MPAHPYLRPAALLLACAGCAAAQAQDTPPITLSASYAVQTDDNPLRLPDGFVAPPGYSLPGSEQLGISTLGLLFQTEQGLQQIDLNASLVHYQYQNHTGQDYTAHNLAAAWRWAVTPRLRGILSASQQEIPNAPSGDTGPNQQNQTAYRADLDYQLGGPWHVVAGAAQNKLSRQFADTAGQEYSSRSIDAGLRFDAPSGSTVQGRIRASQGDYLRNVSSPGNPLDTQFAQVDSELRLHWAFSAASSADVYASALARSHPHVGTRDFSGVGGGASVLWSTSAKTSLGLRYQHDLAAYATYNTNYSATDQLAWDWNWQPSAKTRVRLGQTFAHIAYQGSPTQVAASARTDDTRDTQLSWTWQPRTAWLVVAGLHQIARQSSLAALGYTSNQLTLSAQFTF